NNVSFSPSRTTTVSADLISLAVYGSISIYCNQGNAKIYLDGSSQRTTSANKSVELKNVVQGQHELMITKDGFQQWVSTILVTTNQTQMVSAYLVPEISYGSLAIYCNISGAKIFINGTYKVATLSSQPKILEEIKEGEYEITLVMDGYRTSIEDIWVYAGETTSLSVEMNKIEY
ncbi:MAG: PEGA domain-containing protein, partial [Firmicutes bacterium]|nr:PEGA domain-containing protein [Bacillota bacterium]